MRLKGTITEESFRTELRKTHNYIFNSKLGGFLKQALQEMYPEMKTAYILHWTPDDGSDFYTIIINGQAIVFIEIEEEIKESLFKTSIIKKIIDLKSCPLKDYKRTLSKINQIKLEVAIDLCIKDMKE
ncbi:hypothetical protein [Paenibacillus sp. NFR01]|uniref:hypothetical protein n=1 Tax=Paenibacillus sp. NFR01 TaxID=1566279 RepID=UPI0008BC0DAD|nr:hypothetical protein [Paenibacillus sp. NFR01]SEU33051.1 hypothetical protein SAMN03159358_0180 [Paenibacillus sp. NFR01]